MSLFAVIVVALVVAVFWFVGDRERRECDRERDWREQAEAERDAFEAIFLEEAKERL